MDSSFEWAKKENVTWADRKGIDKEYTRNGG
jgi:hypothetical protein